MKKLIVLVGIFGAGLASAGEVIRCRHSDGSPQLEVTIAFPTDDISKYASFTIKGKQLFTGKEVKQDSCQAFAMRTHVYYNSFVIHNFGCDVWSCSLFTPDTIHGEELNHFKGKLQCSPYDPNQSLLKKFELDCSAAI